MAAQPQIIVVGTGIIGASIAWHLARSGAQVTMIDAGEPGGLATRNSFAWINASWGNPEPYFKLRIRSMAEWRRLESEVPDLRVAWTGGLIWDLPPDQLEAYAREHSDWGYGLNRVDRTQAQAIEPELLTPPEFALHVPAEGAVEPLSAARALIASSNHRGVNVITNTKVQALEQRNAHIVGLLTDAGRFEADHVVLAAGAETAKLASTAGFEFPLTAPPGLLVHTHPVPKLINGLILSPELHLRQTDEGRLVAGTDFAGTDPGTDPAKAAEELFLKLKSFIRSGPSLSLEHYTVGYRPMPEDGFPIIGNAPGVAGLYIAVTHSGITLAPAIGRFVAEEVLSGRRDPLLTPYDPERFRAL